MSTLPALEVLLVTPALVHNSCKSVRQMHHELEGDSLSSPTESRKEFATVWILLEAERCRGLLEPQGCIEKKMQQASHILWSASRNGGTEMSWGIILTFGVFTEGSSEEPSLDGRRSGQF